LKPQCVGGACRNSSRQCEKQYQCKSSHAGRLSTQQGVWSRTTFSCRR
jgi:hypothetical protein